MLWEVVINFTEGRIGMTVEPDICTETADPLESPMPAEPTCPCPKVQEEGLGAARPEVELASEGGGVGGRLATVTEADVSPLLSAPA